MIHIKTQEPQMATDNPVYLRDAAGAVVPLRHQTPPL